MRTLLVAAACGCNHIPLATPPSTGAPGTPIDAAPHTFAVPDETMEFRASLRGITLGYFTTAVGRPGWIDQRHAIIVRSAGHSDGIASLFGDIRYELQTTVDLDAGFPITDREEAWVEFAGQHEHQTGHYAGGDQHDPHSFAAMLRGWRSEPGARTEARVGVGGGHFSVELSHTKTEVIAGKPAIRYDGRAHHRFPFTVWISDDAARVPLAFRADSELGTIGVDLVDYHVTAD
jgi:hypothetical protein